MRAILLAAALLGVAACDGDPEGGPGADVGPGADAGPGADTGLDSARFDGPLDQATPPDRAVVADQAADRGGDSAADQSTAPDQSAAPDARVDQATVDAAPDSAPDAAPDLALDTAPDLAVDAAPDLVTDTGPEAGGDSGADAAAVAPRLVEPFSGVSFNRPVDLKHPGDGTDRVFVIEQTGAIKVIADLENPAATTFLDLAATLAFVPAGGDERGLLGLAFHPDYANNGYFFVNYTAPIGAGGTNLTRVVRYSVDAGNANLADPASAKFVLEVPQPASNHNGGALAFGPTDGYLYIGLGDGGGGGDTYGNGQNRQTLLGSMLRLDVDTAAGVPYAIPADNPFVGNGEGYREEIWAWGFRNPWRFSFDPPTGRLWAGDVGQGAWEEVDLVEKEKNYGWPITEGTHCYPPAVTNCDKSGLTDPLAEYPHPTGTAISGGYVYRGASAPALAGRYIYGDYGAALIWALSYDGVNPAQDELILDASDTLQSISAFGVDRAGELYLCDLFGGKIYRLTQQP